MRQRAAIGPAILVDMCAAVLPRALAAGVVTDCSNDTRFLSLLPGDNVTVNCGGVSTATTSTPLSTKTMGSNTTIGRGGVCIDAGTGRQTYIEP